MFGRSITANKRHSSKSIIRKRREAEVLLAQGETEAMVSRRLEITEQTSYRWRRDYGGRKVDQAKRMKDLEKENARLKRIVVEQALGNAILQESAKGNV